MIPLSPLSLIPFPLGSILPLGWLGPRQMIAFAGGQTLPKYDLWAQFLALEALVQIYAAPGDHE